MAEAVAPLPGPLAALRRFARASTSLETCDLCGAEVIPEHEHLLDPARFELKCTCGRCAILFSAGAAQALRRVPRRLERLPGVAFAEAQWEALGLPISLAYFVRRSTAKRVVAYYPGPAGSTESSLPMEAWEAAEPRLAALADDVEALLINRLGAPRSYLVSIDECFSLVGLIRSNWRGLSGGSETWARVGAFFDRLEERANA